MEEESCKVSEQSKAKKHQPKTLESIAEKLELEIEMELLDIEDCTDNNSNSLLQLKEVEEASQVSAPKPSSNRRYSLRPKKRHSYSDDDNIDMEAESPPKKICITPRKTNSLETIYEVPEKAKNGAVILLGKTKLKRFISFNDFVTKAKTRHRKMKLKRLAQGKSKSDKKLKKPKVTLEDVKQKLQALEEADDDEWMDIEG